MWIDTKCGFPSEAEREREMEEEGDGNRKAAGTGRERATCQRGVGKINPGVLLFGHPTTDGMLGAHRALVIMTIDGIEE